MAEPRSLRERALRILLRTSGHLRCEPEVLAGRLGEGGLWLVLDLVEEACRSLDRALPDGGEERPDAAAVEDALGDLDRVTRLVRGQAILERGWGRCTSEAEAGGAGGPVSTWRSERST